jgi:hypothetical protein
MALNAPTVRPRLNLQDRLLRVREIAALYVGLPVLLTAAMPAKYLLPVLWVAGLAVWVALRRSETFDRRRLTTWHGWRSAWRPMLGRFVVVALLLGVTLWWFRPDLLFRLPRQRPDRWLLIMVLYPLLSVFPQGLIYRALYLHRYAPIFGSARWARVFGVLVFSLAHLPFRNGVAIGFTLVGGYFFLRTYERTESLWLSCLEHALYGNLLFTVGWGWYLYHGGTQALLAG